MNINLVIAGTIGLDDIKTPFGVAKNALGGSGAYSANAASYFVKPGLISVRGKDFPAKYLELMEKIDLSGVTVSDKTFRWSGSYEFDMNEAITLETKLNSLSNFRPAVPKKFTDAKYLLLANLDPDLQLEIINQFPVKPFIVADTMNYWISSKKDKLIEVIKKTNIIVVNEGEARQIFDTPNLIKAGRSLLGLGAEFAIIKKGEHGALMFSNNNYFSAPGYPLEELKDPTGCGDSFAGGLIGYLAKTDDTSEPNIRKAIVYGSAIASCCAESFSLDYRKNTTLKDIKERYDVFSKIRAF